MKLYNLQQCEWTCRILCLVKCQKDKYHMILLIYGIKKIQQSSEYNKKEVDSQTGRTNQ